MKFLKYIILLTFLPLVTHADFVLAGKNFKGIIDYLIELIYILIPVLSSLAFIMFFWGLSKFILNANNATEIQKGKNYMIWGVLALFVLLSVRTIIGLVTNELDFGQNPDESGVLLKTKP